MAGPGKCFLVTGPPGVGKTTLIMKVFEALKTSQPSLQFQGFCTRTLFLYLYELGLIACLKFEKDDDGGFVGEVRQGSERVGFEVVTLDGRRGRLASTTISTEDTDLFIIDEVGKMEMYSSSFFPGVLKVLESNIPLLASVPIPKSGRDIPGVARLKNHPGAIIFTLSTSNRDAVKDQIYTILLDLLTKH